MTADDQYREHGGDEASVPHVWVDRSTCIGSGSCVRLARGAFVLDAGQVAEVVDPAAVHEERLALAERSCPTGAIFIEWS